MNANEVLRIVDSLHREKNIDKEIVFRAIESALITAARKHFGEEADIEFSINRENGQVSGRHGEQTLEYEDVVGRIGAQTAKQVIIQKVREAERDALMMDFEKLLEEIVSGTVHRNEGSVTTVTLGSVEAILPRSEQIPGEVHQPNERIRALVAEVKPQGSRLKVVLSRTRPRFVQRLFEQEIPEIAEGVITINSISREPGYRSKVAVSSIDTNVDCVGACVGIRGNRIKTIIDELAGERIDIVRYDRDPQVMIPNSLQPAQVDEVILCQMLGRAIVLVREDQLSLAIGKRGQNVRLASKLCGWDIEIMTQQELERQIERAQAGFSSLPGVSVELAEKLVGEGYLSYDDLSVIEPDDLMEMGSLTSDQVEEIVNHAEEKAREAERLAHEERRRQQAERAMLSAATAETTTGENGPSVEHRADASQASTGEDAAERS
jgi:N utilization substance protein A